MENNAAPASLKYEEFEPLTETVQEKDCDTILLYLPGFKREKLRVQLTLDKKLTISGEKEVEVNKLVNRFQKEFPVSSNYDTNKISANFERGILYIRLPKLIISPAEAQDTKLPVPAEPPTTTHKPAEKPESSIPKGDPKQSQRTADELKPQENVGQKTAEEISPKDGLIPEKTKVQEVTQKKPEERAEKMAAKKKDEGTGEKLDRIGKTKIDDHKGGAIDLAGKLKMSWTRRLMNVVLVALLAVVIGMYVTNCIRCFRKTAED